MPADKPFEALQIARFNELRERQALHDLAEESLEIGEGVVTYARGVDWISHATMIGFNRDVPEEELDRFEAFLVERGKNPKIDITNFATEPFLASLAKRHFVIKHFENVHIRRLHKGEDPFASMSHPVTKGLEIVRTDPNDHAMCRAHAALVMKGFMPEPIPEEEITIAVRSIVHPRAAGFMALIDGEPAGACGMEIFEHEGMRTAALWGAVVAEPFRRRGIQQAMLAHRMAYGLERGCDVSTIESKPGIATERNVARMGFSLGYVRVCMEKMEPGSHASKA